MRKPIERYILYILIVFLSLNGIGGGIVFIIEPDGSLMGMTTAWLVDTPFKDYMLPGICLFILNGLFPFITFTGLIWRKDYRLLNYLNIFKDRHWSWAFSVYSGIITISWIIIQQLIAGFFVLQPIISSLGLLILIISLLPGVQRYYTNENLHKYAYERK